MRGAVKTNDKSECDRYRHPECEFCNGFGEKMSNHFPLKVIVLINNKLDPLNTQGIRYRTYHNQRHKASINRLFHKQLHIDQIHIVVFNRPGSSLDLG